MIPNLGRIETMQDPADLVGRVMRLGVPLRHKNLIRLICSLISPPTVQKAKSGPYSE